MDKVDYEKRQLAFQKEQDRLIAKYPDKADRIKEVFGRAFGDGCNGCKSRRLLIDLFGELGENITQQQNSMNQQVPPNVMAMQSEAPRPPCEECFKEHIAKAVVLLTEAGLGYPEHRWLAIANLAEASAEIMGINIVLANEVRGVKLRMIQDKTFIPNLMKYLGE